MRHALPTATTWQQTPGVAAVQGAEAGLPWEQALDRGSADQETWLLSFIDVLTLLLTLFVLLLAYQHQSSGAATPTVASVEQPTGVSMQPERDATPENVLETAAVVEQEARPPVERMPVEIETLPPPAPTPIDYLHLPETLYVETDAALVQQVAQAKVEPAMPDPVDGLLAALSNSRLGDRVEIHPQPGGVDLEISDSILFAPASADLTAGGELLLDELAATLIAQPYTLSVEGHSDDRPIATSRYPSNWELSSARATRVTRHLVGQGVAPERVRAIGYADTRPRAENASPEGRSRNRRVSFVLRMPAT